MAVTKPGTAKGDYIWTGFKWVRKAQRTNDKVIQQKLLAKEKERYYNSVPLKESNKGQPLASYPGQRAPAMRKPLAASAPAAATPAKTSTYDYSRRPARTVNGSPKTLPPSGSGPSASAGNGSGGGAGTTRRADRTPARKVLQQNTEWVKKGQTVGGKVVAKGYLAQKGKQEKRVTARVKIQTATESGKKAGSTYAYKAGKTVKKVGKK